MLELSWKLELIGSWNEVEGKSQQISTNSNSYISVNSQPILVVGTKLDVGTKLEVGNKLDIGTKLEAGTKLEVEGEVR